MFYFNTNIYTGRELPDSLSLEECGVENGATLKLILAMRGGPINTRRVVISNTSGRNPSEHGPNENATSSHIEDIMLKNKDKLLDKIPKNGQVFEFVSIITMLRTKFILLPSVQLFLYITLKTLGNGSLISRRR